MKLLLSILALLPLFGLSQVKYDTIYVMHYVSNPPVSIFMCDSVNCEGYCASYYEDGTLFRKGRFEKGQPIDSLFTYYQNGQLEELFIPNKKGWRMLNYYPNGQLKSDYDVAKRREKTYYESGVLKTEQSWNRRYKTKIKKYDANGNLILTESNKKQKQFYANGTLKSSISRREILVFDRLFERDGGDRHTKFYLYTWKDYDAEGTMTRSILFDAFDFPSGPFPASIDQIDDYLFEEITFYTNGKKSHKMELIYVFVDGEYVDQLILYQFIEQEWVEEKRTTPSKVYELIAVYSE